MADNYIDAYTQFNKDTKGIPLIPDDELNNLLIKAQTGDIEAQNKIVLGNIRLVRSVVKNYTINSSNLDLIQVGIIGLIQAINTFNDSKGTKFSTYAVSCIRNEVFKEMANFSSPLKVSRHLLKHFKALKSAEYELQARGITPTIPLLAQELNINETKVKNILNNIKMLDSFSLDINYSQSFSDNPEDIIMKDIEHEILHSELNKLTEREQLIFKYSFGFDNLEPLFNYEIGKILGITDSRVQQIKSQKIKQLRKKLAR